MQVAQSRQACREATEVLYRVFQVSAPPSRPHVRNVGAYQKSRFHAHAPQTFLYQPIEPRQNKKTTKIPANLLHPGRDEGIQSGIVQLVDSETNKLSEQRLNDVLATMDRQKFFLVRVSHPDDPGIPICKTLPKRAVHEAEKAKQTAAHMADHSRKGNSKQKKGPGEAGKMKIVEVAWGSEPGDLDVKMRRMTEFLEDGLKVEIGLHVKKRSKAVSQEKAQSIVDRVKEDISNVQGRIVREEGKAGELLRILAEPSQQAKDAKEAARLAREAREAEEAEKKEQARKVKAEERKAKVEEEKKLLYARNLP
jgi:translation initiation factor IF-3